MTPKPYSDAKESDPHEREDQQDDLGPVRGRLQGRERDANESGGLPDANKGAEGSASLRVVPVSFRDASEFVALWHRHNQPPNGHRFSIGVARGDTLCGVAIVSHPVARMLMDGRTLEVIRTATDGTPNANSMLYGACWRAAKALGYDRLVTYTQHDESGSSLRAAGWRVVAERPPTAGWDRPSRPREDKGTAWVARTLWEAS